VHEDRGGVVVPAVGGAAVPGEELAHPDVAPLEAARAVRRQGSVHRAAGRVHVCLGEPGEPLAEPARLARVDVAGHLVRELVGEDESQPRAHVAGDHDDRLAEPVSREVRAQAGRRELVELLGRAERDDAHAPGDCGRVVREERGDDPRPDRLQLARARRRPPEEIGSDDKVFRRKLAPRGTAPRRALEAGSVPRGVRPPRASSAAQAASATRS
jgi:hypothetical protein